MIGKAGNYSSSSSTPPFPRHRHCMAISLPTVVQRPLWGICGRACFPFDRDWQAYCAVMPIPRLKQQHEGGQDLWRWELQNQSIVRASFPFKIIPIDCSKLPFPLSSPLLSIKGTECSSILAIHPQQTQQHQSYSRITPRRPHLELQQNGIKCQICFAGCKSTSSK